MTVLDAVAEVVVPTTARDALLDRVRAVAQGPLARDAERLLKAFFAARRTSTQP